MGYKNVWEPKGVYRRYSGRVSGTTIRNAVEEIEADYRFDLIRYVINDYLAVTETDVKDIELKLIAAIDSAASTYNQRIKIAQVTTCPDVTEIVTYYANQLRDNTYKTQIFSTLEDARIWVEEY